MNSSCNSSCFCCCLNWSHTRSSDVVPFWAISREGRTFCQFSHSFHSRLYAVDNILKLLILQYCIWSPFASWGDFDKVLLWCLNCWAAAAIELEPSLCDEKKFYFPAVASACALKSTGLAPLSPTYCFALPLRSINLISVKTSAPDLLIGYPLLSNRSSKADPLCPKILNPNISGWYVSGPSLGYRSGYVLKRILAKLMPK